MFAWSSLFVLLQIPSQPTFLSSFLALIARTHRPGHNWNAELDILKMDALEDCFISHKDVGGFYAKEVKRHFAPFLTPPSSPSFNQHPTPSSTAVDSPPNVVSPRTPASDQSTPVYTGTHLPQDADDVTTGEASKKDDEGKSMNSIEDEDADAEGEEDDGQWIPATHGGLFPPPAHQDDSFSSTLTPSSLSPAAPSAYTTTHAETSCTQSAIDDASNAHHHHSNAVHIAHTDRANLPFNSIDAGSDDPQRQVHFNRPLPGTVLPSPPTPLWARWTPPVSLTPLMDGDSA
ncbi:hypothetical protein EV122DRAFT_256364 [Schizophyllum commune]